RPLSLRWPLLLRRAASGRPALSALAGGAAAAGGNCRPPASRLTLPHKVARGIHMARTAKQLNDRSPGISYQELIAQDAVPPPRTLTLESPLDVALTSVLVSRYTSREFYDLEM